MFLIYFSAEVYKVSPKTLSNNDLEVNINIVYLGEVTGYFLITLFSKTVPRKALFYGCFIIQIVCSFVFIYNSFFEFNKKELNSVINLIFSTILSLTTGGSFGILFVYLSELFPTKIRATALGMLILFGKMGAGFTGYITEFENIRQYHTYSVIILFDLLALIPFFYLPETYKQRI